MRTCLLALIGSVILVAPTCFAQDAFANAARQRSENISAPAVPAAKTNGDGTALPNDVTDDDREADADLGQQWVLRRNERVLRCNIMADVSAFETTNVALAHADEHADTFLVASLSANYARPILGFAVLNLAVAESSYRYDRYTAFDFDSLSAALGLSMPVKQLWNSQLAIQTSLTRLTRDFVSSQLFSGETFAVSLTKSIQLTTADSVAFGLASAFNLADPSSLERGDVSVFGGYNLALTRRLSSSINYRASFFDYPNASRVDVNQTLAASLRFEINRWLSIGVSTSAVLNNSSVSAFDYNAVTFGGGLTGNIQF